MTAHPEISAVVNVAALSYGGSLENFRPWRKTRSGNYVIDERNITFNFCRAFVNTISCSSTFVEVPFDGVRANARLDAYCFSAQIGILLEVKTFTDRTEIGGVLSDIERLSSSAVSQVTRRHSGTCPSELRAVVLVESWKAHNRALWVQDASSNESNGFDSTVLTRMQQLKLAGWCFSAVPIPAATHHAGGQSKNATDQCHWLYCVSPPIYVGATESIA